MSHPTTPAEERDVTRLRQLENFRAWLLAHPEASPGFDILVCPYLTDEKMVTFYDFMAGPAAHWTERNESIALWIGDDRFSWKPQDEVWIRAILDERGAMIGESTEHRATFPPS